MSRNLGGRPNKYPDDELLKVLEEYVNKLNGQKIVLSKLARETGIARYIWDYSKNIKEIIEKLNNPVIVISEISEELKTIVAVETTVEQSLNTPRKRKLYAETCSRVINSLIGKVEKYYQLEKIKTDLENQVIELKNEIKQLKEQNKKQETAMLELCIDSESLKKRNEKGLKNNIIRIDVKSNIDKAISVTEDNIIKEFPWLAD